MGATTILISNNENSPINNHCHYFLNMFSGEEKSVAATKSFVQTLLVLIKLVFYCLERKDINENIKNLSELLLERF